MTRHSRAVSLPGFRAATLVLATMMASCGAATTSPARSPAPQTGAASASLSASLRPTTPATALPDQGHGFFTLRPSALRAEASSATLAAMPEAQTAAASPDGHRLAIVERTGQGGQLVTFETSRPSQPTFRLVFSGSVVDNRASGEFPSGVIWAGDGSDSILITVDVGEAASSYTSTRAVDLQTRQVRELARVGFVPLAWHPASDTAVGWASRGDGGFADSYVLLQGDRVTRSAFPIGQVIGNSVRASLDGRRVLAVYGATSALSGGAIRWWPFDRFDQQKQLPSASGDWIRVALWRPGADEVVVSVSAGTSTPTDPRLEIRPLQGAPRVLRSSGGLLIVRSDGTAALAEDYVLVDLATGAMSPVPRLSPMELPYIALRL